jgi:N-acyl-D-aspartate/D-glutamate deacylase
MPVTLIIRGGTVYDGGSGPGRRADVAVDGDRIAAVGSVPHQAGAREIDAAGLAVAPGFINILSHAWGTLQTEPRAPSDLLQGVTTEIFGAGVSLGPATPEFLQLLEQSGLTEGQRADFGRLSDGLDHLERHGIAPNVASFVGGHNLRVIGGGLADGPLPPETLDRLRGILAEEMADGALGEPPWTARPTHPRTYGAFSRFLGRYSRDLGLVALPEAVRRMTGLPAETLRLRDRGRLIAGSFADIVIFDPSAVSDHATYEQPHQYATGVRHLLVNGQLVVSGGELTGALPGRRLRREP